MSEASKKSNTRSWLITIAITSVFLLLVVIGLVFVNKYIRGWEGTKLIYDRVERE
jgi:hypothetical protein